MTSGERDTPRGGDVGGPRHRRGDEWADPWMRGEPNRASARLFLKRTNVFINCTFKEIIGVVSHLQKQLMSCHACFKENVNFYD